MAPDRRQKQSPPNQSVTFYAFDPSEFPEQIYWHGPPLSGGPPPQLTNILRHLELLGCKTVAVEDHYIDRDYMEDHATFYSKSFCSYPNHCVRAHFFRTDSREIESGMSELVKSANVKGLKQFRAGCADFSGKHYLGFMVIKPLPGCPVGRTVLHPLFTTTNETTVHKSVRLYRVHFGGIELEIVGLAFQQQDYGVSACATTAIWSAFQKIRDFEEVAAASPAHITMLAARYTLPFGRAMPSEGLSTDQMCLAIQALGASPLLLRATDFATDRGYLYSIGLSSMSCILIMHKVKNDSEYHAVSAVGMECYQPQGQSGREDRSEQLIKLFVHDDRLGPYMTARLEESSDGKLHLQFESAGENLPDEEWKLAQILLPMHSKVSFSFAELWEIGIWDVIPIAKSSCTEKLGIPHGEQMQFDIRVVRAQAYLEEVLLQGNALAGTLVQAMSKTVAFSRYIGVIRLASASTGSLDVIVDTTSTLKSPVFLLVVALSDVQKGAELVTELGRELQCRSLIVT